MQFFQGCGNFDFKYFMELKAVAISGNVKAVSSDHRLIDSLHFKTISVKAT